MVSALASGRAARVRALAGDIALCSWARHFTLTVPLSTQVYKWVPANLMLGVTLRWTSIPSRGEYKYSQSLHATETGIIIYMKKLLDSDWLRAVQFKCNTSAKSVTPVQITHRNSGL